MGGTGLDPLSEERIARNDALFRDANEGIEASALGLGWDDEDRIPFVCECADRDCRAFLRLTLPEYEEIRARPRTFLNSPGHQVAAQGAAVVVAENDRYFVVEKIGHAGEVAERLDPRADEDAAGRRAVC